MFDRFYFFEMFLRTGSSQHQGGNESIHLIVLQGPQFLLRGIEE